MFIHSEDIAYLPIYFLELVMNAGLPWQPLSTPNIYTFLGICLRGFGCFQRQGMPRSFSAHGNKMHFCWKLLHGKGKD